MIVGLPRRRVGRRPVAEQPGRKILVPAAASHDVMGTIPELFDLLIADFDERFRPEVAPPLSVRLAERFDLLDGDFLNPFPGNFQRIVGFLVCDDRGDDNHRLTRR